VKISWNTNLMLSTVLLYIWQLNKNGFYVCLLSTHKPLEFLKARSVHNLIGAL
jgi:hypothetical protein